MRYRVNCVFFLLGIGHCPPMIVLSRNSVGRNSEANAFYIWRRPD